MKLECILHRPGGTTVDLDGQQYHFAPTEEGPHACEIENEDHIDRLLAIPEGYRLCRLKTTEMEVVERKVESVTPSHISGPLPAGAPANLDEMNRAQLLDYAELVGMRRPHPAAKDETIRQNVKMALQARLED